MFPLQILPWQMVIKVGSQTKPKNDPMPKSLVKLILFLVGPRGFCSKPLHFTDCMGPKKQFTRITSKAHLKKPLYCDCLKVALRNGCNL